MWISLGSKLFRCGKLRERMTKEQSNGVVPENLEQEKFINTTDVIAAIEDILGMGRLSKFDYFSRSLADIFAPASDLTPYDPIIPEQDLNEKNPENTAAARFSESLDLSAPDRVDDQLYNRILWLMLKGDVPPPVAQSHAALHALQSSK
jgi:hypothetical protein